MCECCGHSTETVTLNVKGMTCNHCAEGVKKSIQELKGVKKVVVDLDNGKVNVEYNPNDIRVDLIADAIKNEGYDVD